MSDNETDTNFSDHDEELDYILSDDDSDEYNDWKHPDTESDEELDIMHQLQNQFVFAMRPDLRLEHEQFKQQQKEKTKLGFINHIEVQYKKMFGDKPPTFIIDIWESAKTIKVKLEEISKLFLQKDYFRNEFDEQASFIPIIEFINYIEKTYQIDCSKLDNMKQKYFEYDCLKQLEKVPDLIRFMVALGFKYDQDSIVQLIKQHDPLLFISDESEKIIANIIIFQEQDQFYQYLETIKQNEYQEKISSFNIASEIWSILYMKQSETLTLDQHFHIIINCINWLNNIISHSKLIQHIIQSILYKYQELIKYSSVDQFLELKQSFKSEINISCFQLIKCKNFDLLKYYITNTSQDKIQKEFKQINTEFKFSSFIYLEKCLELKLTDEEHLIKCINTIDVICQFPFIKFHEVIVCEMLEKICQQENWKELINKPGLIQFIKNNSEIVLNYHYNIYYRSYQIFNKIKSFYEQITA